MHFPEFNEVTKWAFGMRLRIVLVRIIFDEDETFLLWIWSFVERIKSEVNENPVN